MDTEYEQLNSEQEDQLSYNYQDDLNSTCGSTDRKADLQKRSRSAEPDVCNAGFSDIYSQPDILAAGFKLKFGTKRLAIFKGLLKQS